MRRTLTTPTIATTSHGQSLAATNNGHPGRIRDTELKPYSRNADRFRSLSAGVPHANTTGAPVPRSIAQKRALKSALLLLSALVAALALVTPAGAEDYPLPTHQTGSVNKTVFQPGDLVVFSGDGYITRGHGPHQVDVADNDTERGTAKVDRNGAFQFTFRFTSSDTLGQHTLVARGTGANTAPRDTTAVVYLVGVETLARTVGSFSEASAVRLVDEVGQGGNGAGAGGQEVSGLPFTGTDVRDLVLLGLGLVALGAVLTLRNQRIRAARRLARRQRRAAQA